MRNKHNILCINEEPKLAVFTQRTVLLFKHHWGISDDPIISGTKCRVS